MNGSRNYNLDDWICQGCPEGGDCRGPKLWKDLYALYGYMRLGIEDFVDRRDAFQRCFRPQACLGGKIELPTRERPGTKHSWMTRSRPSIDCCSAVDPLQEDLRACEKDPENFRALSEHERGMVGFNPKERGCKVDLALVDDPERCHVEAGFRLNCSYTKSGKCRLCRACTKGYWPQGVSKCLKCPHPIVNVILVICAIFAILIMLMGFLSSALQDTGAEAQSTVVHFSQAQQKIILNHIQLISLASAFPLKWPDEIEAMFEVMSLVGNAGSYMFNPACSDIEIIEGESMFFQKQLGILMLPFIAIICCAIFWLLSYCRDCIDPAAARVARHKRRLNQRREKRQRKLRAKNAKKRASMTKKTLQAEKIRHGKIHKKNEARKKRASLIELRRTGFASEPETEPEMESETAPLSAQKQKDGDRGQSKHRAVAETERKSEEEEKSHQILELKVNPQQASEKLEESKKRQRQEGKKEERTNAATAAKGKKKVVADEDRPPSTKGAAVPKNDNILVAKVEKKATAISMNPPPSSIKLNKKVSAEKKARDKLGSQGVEYTTSVFHHMDKKGSGKLTRKKMRKLLTRLEIPENEIKSLFSRIDSNGDDVVSCDEFVQWIHGSGVTAAPSSTPQIEETTEPTNKLEKDYQSSESKQEVNIGGEETSNDDFHDPFDDVSDDGEEEQQQEEEEQQQEEKEEESDESESSDEEGSSVKLKKIPETHQEKLDRLSRKWDHLNTDNDDQKDEQKDSQTMIITNDNNNHGIKDVLDFINFDVHPLFPVGIVWGATERELEKKKNKKRKSKTVLIPMQDKAYGNKLEGVFPAKIKRITSKKTQAGMAGCRDGDYLYSVGGKTVKNLSYDDVQSLFRDAQTIGRTYTIVLCHKVHGMKSRIRDDVSSRMQANQLLISTFDKFVATMVTMLYLLYPTVTKSTFQLVACQQVGGRSYLQMDLDIPCFEEVHMRWVMNLFLPAAFLGVFGLPFMTLVALVPRRHSLHDRWTRFRFGVLYTGYTDGCFYWETVIAARKAFVIMVSVFMTTAGAEAQALCCMMIVMGGTVFHLLFRPMQKVTEEHNTLFWTEFWGLQVAFCE